MVYIRATETACLCVLLLHPRAQLLERVNPHCNWFSSLLPLALLCQLQVKLILRGGIERCHHSCHFCAQHLTFQKLSGGRALGTEKLGAAENIL